MEDKGALLKEYKELTARLKEIEQILDYCMACGECVIDKDDHWREQDPEGSGFYICPSLQYLGESSDD